MSKVTHVGVHHVDTLFLFCSVPFVLDHLEINFALLLQRLVSLSFKKTTVHINLLAEYFSLEIDVCVILFVDLIIRYLTFSHHTIQNRFSRITSFDCFVCCICHYGLDQALFHQLEVFGQVCHQYDRFSYRTTSLLGLHLTTI